MSTAIDSAVADAQKADVVGGGRGDKGDKSVSNFTTVLLAEVPGKSRASMTGASKMDKVPDDEMISMFVGLAENNVKDIAKLIGSSEVSSEKAIPTAHGDVVNCETKAAVSRRNNNAHDFSGNRLGKKMGSGCPAVKPGSKVNVVVDQNASVKVYRVYRCGESL